MSSSASSIVTEEDVREGQVFVFRADASEDIGSGHVMRCLTLAEELRAQGHSSIFVSRSLPGNLIELVRSRGFLVRALKPLGADAACSAAAPNFRYEPWLSGGWDADAAETIQALRDEQIDWLVVDHYGIDERWESALRQVRREMGLLVIDDLADRRHVSDILLDQNLGRNASDYGELVPSHCDVLAGVSYSLLRPEFPAAREMSLARRNNAATPRRLLVNLGGVDKDNVTKQVIESLEDAPSMPRDLSVDVVMGPTAPHLEEVQAVSAASSLDIVVHAGTTQMASLMAESDVAIGAAGGTSWERCCLGLPSIVVVLAANQRHLAAQLEGYGIAQTIDQTNLPETLWDAWETVADPTEHVRMAHRAASLVDGMGTARVVQSMMKRRGLQ